MGIKANTQEAYYDLQGGDFEASLVVLAQSGENVTAVFTQSEGTTAMINQQLRLGAASGTTGEAIYNLDGGVLTIDEAADNVDLTKGPFQFTQPGAPVYFDFDGGTLNLKGVWDYNSLTGIQDADFRVAGIAATADLLDFTTVMIDAESFTQITSGTANAPGDYNGDGTVNRGDAVGIAADFRTNDANLSLLALTQANLGNGPSPSANPAAVPEPGTFLLAAVGILGLAGHRRRRRR